MALRRSNDPGNMFRGNVKWSNEQCRLFLNLYLDQKRVGNYKDGYLTRRGRDKVMAEFYKHTGLWYQWKKFKNKLDTLGRNYAKFKRLTKNASGFGYDIETGQIVADDGWWESQGLERQDMEAIKKLRDIPMLEELFDKRFPTGDEGWNPALSSHSPEESSGSSPDDVTQSHDDDTHATSSMNRTSSSHKRKRDDPTCSLYSRKRSHVEQKIQELIRRMRKPKETYKERLKRKNLYAAVMVAWEFQQLPGVQLGSPLYFEGLKLFKDENHRQMFSIQPTDELKLQYVVYMTRTRRDSDFV